MSTTKSFAGQSFNLPLNREPKSSQWGTQVSNFLIALADYAIPKTGGSYTLSAELNLGASYGVLAPYFKSATANIASAGQVRLARADTIGWRNQANSGDLALSVNSSNVLQFNGVSLATTASKLSAFAATTSAELAGVISDETGSGSLVFATNPTFISPQLGTPSSGTLTNCTGLPIAGGGTGQTTAAAALKALAAYSAKGQLVGYDGSAVGLLTVGADGTVLQADAASTYGIKWATPLTNPMSATGDLIVGGASGAATRLAANSTATKKILTETSSTAAWNQIDATGYFTTGAEVTQSAPGIVKSAGQLLGTNTNDSAGAGYVGEYVESVVSSNTNLPGASTVWSDATSISITAGHWLVYGQAQVRLNGATGFSSLAMAVSANNGATTTDQVGGDNQLNMLPPTGADYSTATIVWNKKVTSTTTIYLKFLATYATATPQYKGKIFAVRVR